MLSGEGNENCEIQQFFLGLIAARSFLHFLAVVLPDYMKRPETSWFSHFHQMRENLILEQTEVAKSGHNLLVTGQAGTGKSVNSG